jgi:hypothetical protein
MSVSTKSVILRWPPALAARARARVGKQGLNAYVMRLVEADLCDPGTGQEATSLRWPEELLAWLRERAGPRGLSHLVVRVMGRYRDQVVAKGLDLPRAPGG